MQNRKALGRSLRIGDPIQGFVQGTKRLHPCFAVQAPVGFNHFGDLKLNVVFHQQRAPGIRGKNSSSGNEAYVIRRDCKARKVCVIVQLRERWIEIRIGR